MIKKIRAFKDLVTFLRPGYKPHKIIIFSEGRNSWPHLKDVLDEIISNTDFHISYVSSMEDDPGLQKKHPKLKVFYVGSGAIRDVFFKNVAADFFICTTPDLDCSRFVRSKKTPIYIYVPHSIFSLHMIYNQHAFDNFDVMCCVGPHHLREVRQLEKFNKAPKKELLKFGYRHLVSPENLKRVIKKNAKIAFKTILIAPSWGEKALIESGRAYILIGKVLGMNIKTILRPHPETLKRSPKEIQKIESIFGGNKRFSLDQEVSSFASMEESQVLITDWSGASMEYAFRFKKPVVFCDVDRKINNMNYKKLEAIPVEIAVRNKIGIIWDMKTNFTNVLEKLITFDDREIDSTLKCLIFSNHQVNNVLSQFLRSYQPSKR